jgi:hypothetical protein
MVGTPVATDQVLGVGDGVRTEFALVKLYGTVEPETRRITLSFATPPANGATVTAGFLFDVPVRFAEDSLAVDAQTWLAGDAPDVPLVEVRED